MYLHRNTTCDIRRAAQMPAWYSLTHRSGCISKVDLEASHGSDDGDDGLDGVAVDNGLVLLTFLL